MARTKSHPRLLSERPRSNNMEEQVPFSSSSSSSSSSSELEEEDLEELHYNMQYINLLVKADKTNDEIKFMKQMGAHRILFGHEGLIREPPINYIIRYLTSPNILNSNTFLTHELEFAVESIRILNIDLNMPYRYMMNAPHREAMVTPLTAIIQNVALAQSDHQQINYRHFIAIFFRFVMLGANPNANGVWIVRIEKKAIDRDFSMIPAGATRSLFSTLFSRRIPPEIIMSLIELTGMLVPHDFDAQLIVSYWCLSVDHIRVYALSPTLRPLMPTIMQQVRHFLSLQPYRILPNEFAAMQHYFPPPPHPPIPRVFEE